MAQGGSPLISSGRASHDLLFGDATGSDVPRPDVEGMTWMQAEGRIRRQADRTQGGGLERLGGLSWRWTGFVVLCMEPVQWC